MEITRSNFRSSLPVVEEAITDADFVSIDTEFTGLTTRDEKVHLYDSPSERYKKLCKNTESFIQLQFGLCCFKWIDDTKSYESKAFNFYIFPFASSNLRVPDRTFSCQSSSIDFLASQGYDFNKTFCHGIPYMRHDEIEPLRKQVDEKLEKIRSHASRNNKNNKGPGIKLEFNKKLNDFVDKITDKVTLMMDDPDSNEVIITESCSSFYRKALHEFIPKRFEGKVFLDYKTTKGRRQMVIYKGTESEVKQAKQEEMLKENEDAYEDAVGFTKVIKMLTENKKLIIGHNMMYDVLYAVRQYICDLPNDLDDFKSLASCVFPTILDTKLMSQMLPFKDLIDHTGLNDLYTALKQEPFEQVKLEAPIQYLGEDVDLQKNLHQAAYDAYITGYAYILMFHHLNKNLDSSKKTYVPSSEASAVQPYLNKINLTHVHEIPYLNINGPDLAVNYDDVFHMEFPPEWKIQEVREKFSPYQINISWVNQTSCFVRLMEKDAINAARAMVLSAKDIHCTVRTFKSYQKQKAEEENANNIEENDTKSDEENNNSNGDDSSPAKQEDLSSRKRSIEKRDLEKETDCFESKKSKKEIQVTSGGSTGVFEVPGWS